LSTCTYPLNYVLKIVAIGKVLDERLRVEGVANLRIADANIMPNDQRGHPVLRMATNRARGGAQVAPVTRSLPTGLCGDVYLRVGAEMGGR
jgi:hypothetical protein